MKTNLFDITSKVVVVTGGTGVLGHAMVKGLAMAGAKVGILGRREEIACSRAEEIRELGGQAIPLKADVLQINELELAYDRIIGEWGRVDVLINAAGGNMPGATIMPDQTFLDLSPEHLKKVMDLNQLGTIFPSQVFVKSMIENKSGTVINISSMAAQRPLTRVVGYAASKAAIDNFTRWLAVEMARKFGEGIRVNAVAPGFFLTEQNRSLLLQENGEVTERGKLVIQHTPMNRFGAPEELVGTIIWLCSEAARFVTGTVIPVDGGFSASTGI